MRVFAVKFSGHYLGGHAVVVAEDAKEARKVFKKELRKEGDFLVIKNKERGSIEIEEVGGPGEWPACLIQFNGDY